jgi:protein TonB
MQASFNLPGGSPVTNPAEPKIRPIRLYAVLAVVVLAHVALFIVATHLRDKPAEVQPVTVTMMAELLQPAPVETTMVAPQPPAAPPQPSQPPQPAPKPARPAPPKHHQVTKPTPVVTATPTPVAAATPPAPATPEPAAPAPAAPAAPPAPAMTQPAASSAPLNVRQISCDSTPPIYPMMSKRRGESGTAVIRILIDTTGRVESAEISKTSGYDALDAAARQAALSSKCSPYIQNGQAVRAVTSRPYRFSLTDSN